MAQDSNISTSLKRPSASQSPVDEPATKRQKQHYHHHHKLHHPVKTQLREPALFDDSAVTHLLERSIGQILTKTGYDIAEPAALDAFRQATEECMYRPPGDLRYISSNTGLRYPSLGIICAKFNDSSETDAAHPSRFRIRAPTSLRRHR